jgi:hypothetical protein
VTTSVRASRRRVAPVTGWSYHHHFLITYAFGLAVIAILFIGGA